MRLFVALDLDPEIRRRIARFLDGVREFAPDAKWVIPESLHVTLKFIGEQPPERVEEMERALADIKAATVEIAFRGYGFFPTPKSARVFWVGIEAGPELSELARKVDEVTARFGIEREERDFTPHLTLARARDPRGRGGRASGSPRQQARETHGPQFARMQEKLAPLSPPEFGTMTAREFDLFESKLSPKGAKYTKLASFSLR